MTAHGQRKHVDFKHFSPYGRITVGKQRAMSLATSSIVHHYIQTKQSCVCGLGDPGGECVKIAQVEYGYIGLLAGSTNHVCRMLHRLCCSSHHEHMSAERAKVSRDRPTHSAGRSGDAHCLVVH